MDKEEVNYVKVEDEFGIFVKEEEKIIKAPNNNEDYDENASILKDLLLEPDPEFIGKELLVYTTKVDDIWGKNREIENNILEIIENESKPVFTGQFKKKKKRKYMIKFNYFVQNLKEYNCSVIDYDSNKRQNTPVEKYEHSPKRKAVQKQKKYTRTFIFDNDSDTDSCVSSSRNSDDKVDFIPVVKRKSSQVGDQSLESKSQTNTPHIVVTIQESRSCLHDVYVVSKEGIPKELYQFVKGNRRKSTIPSSTCKININSCCWYKRAENIKPALPDFCISIRTFMRKSHGCEPNQCKCCCKRKYYGKNKKVEAELNLTLNTKETKQERNYFRSRWHQRLLQKPEQQSENSIINEALFNTPKKKINQKQSKKSNYPDTYLNLKIDETQEYSFYIKKNGMINTMVKIPNNHDTSFTTNNFKNIIGIQHSQEVVEPVCCLDKYKKYILKLVNLGKTNVAKLLTNSCVFSSDKCVNCERNEIQYSSSVQTSLVKISIPKYPKHAKNYTKKKLLRRNITTNKNITQISKTDSTDIEKSDKTVMLELNSTEIPKIKKTLDTVERISTKTPNVSTNLIDVDNFQLIIKPGEKIKIQTQSIPEKISTTNLKMLKEIILYAYKKINSYKLNITETIKICDLLSKMPLNTKKIKAGATQKKQLKALSAKESVPSGKKQLNDVKGNKINNKRSDSVTSTSENISTGLEYETLYVKTSIYQSFTNINAHKRKQYLLSHDFITNAATDIWTNVKMLDHSIGSKAADWVMTHSHKETVKRKMEEVGTLPPPKQKRQDISDEIATPSSNISLPSTSGSLLQSALMRPFVPPTLKGESVMSNATVTALPNNVTIIPLGQLPQDLVNSIYKQYAVLEPSQQHNKEQIIIPGPIHLTEHAITQISTQNAEILPAPAQMTSNVIPVVVPVASTPMKVENIEIEVDKEEECILGT